MGITVSIASGKGGVGKSVIAGNLGLALAQHGHRVVLVDLDVGGSDLHILFGLLSPSVTLTDFIERRVSSLQDVVQPLVGDRLRLLPGTGETLATANMPYATKKRLVRHLQQVDADYLIVDVGAGTGYHALDFFLMADHQLAVATPDPTSVLDLYRFIKLAAIRRVLSRVVSRNPLSDGLAGRDFASIQEVLQAAGTIGEAGQELAHQAMQGYRPLLLLNRTSARSRVNTLHLQKVLRQYVGGELTLLGEIPEDPAVEQSVRAYLPVLDFAPHSPAARALMEAAERLLLHTGPRPEAISTPV